MRDTGGVFSSQCDYNLDVIANNGAAYYADITDGGGCSTTRLEVVAVIYGNIPSNVNVFVGICADNNSTIADLSLPKLEEPIMFLLSKVKN